MGIAIAVAGGMVFASIGLVSLLELYIAAALLLPVSVLTIKYRISTRIIFGLVAVVAACCYLVSSPQISQSNCLRSPDSIPRNRVAVIGRISEFPEFHADRSGQRGSWVSALRCEGIQRVDQWEKVRGVINVSIRGAAHEQPVQYGQRVLISGRLSKRTFPGGNPIEMKLYSGDSVKLLAPAGLFSLKKWGRFLRDAAAVRLEEGLGPMPEQCSVLKALVLGDREDVPAKDLALFRRTGTFHIFAISGLHVGIVGLFLVIVLKTMGIPRDWFGVWLLPLLGLYVVSTGMKSSALRALTMAGIFLLAPLFRKRPDIPSSVAFAALMLLLFRPLEIQSAGFIFSFTVVSFLVMVYTKVPDHLKQGGWVRSYAMGLIITSLAANMASIPLSALFFGTFSPIALLGNLVVVPLTFCIVLAGWLAILIPGASVIFSYAAVAFVNLLLGSVRWLDSWPGSSWHVDPPSRLALLLWYGSLIYFFTHAKGRRQRGYAVWGATCAVLLALLA